MSVIYALIRSNYFCDYRHSRLFWAVRSDDLKILSVGSNILMDDDKPKGTDNEESNEQNNKP